MPNVYVYGVVPASERASVPDAGVAGAQVRTVEHGDLAAIVSDLEDDSLVAAREVRAHWRVVEAAAAAATGRDRPAPAAGGTSRARAGTSTRPDSACWDRSSTRVG